MKFYQILTRGEDGFSSVNTNIYANYKEALERKNNLSENYPNETFWIVSLKVCGKDEMVFDWFV